MMRNSEFGALGRGAARGRSLSAVPELAGLTAALALAAKGFRVVVVEQAARLEETGAGIQLSPNATHVLSALGLADRLASVVVAPEAVTGAIVPWPRDRARAARSRRRAVDGSPYWVVHRGDLQAALLGAVRANSRYRAAAWRARGGFSPFTPKASRSRPPHRGGRPGGARHCADRCRRACGRRSGCGWAMRGRRALPIAPLGAAASCR